MGIEGVGMKIELNNVVIDNIYSNCGICGGVGANVIVTSHCLHSNNIYHQGCLDKETRECGHCHKVLPMEEMIVSYWHAFEWRCEDCESKCL
jgi:hypothetical protein